VRPAFKYRPSFYEEAASSPSSKSRGGTAAAAAEPTEDGGFFFTFPQSVTAAAGGGGGGGDSDNSGADGTSLQDVQDAILALESEGWLDAGTRSLEMQVFFYSSAAERLFEVSLELEFPAEAGVGACFASHQVRIFKLNTWEFRDKDDVMTLLLYTVETLVALFAVRYAWEEVKQWRKEPLLYFLNIFNYMDIAIYCIFVWMFYNQWEIQELTRDMLEADGDPAALRVGGDLTRQLSEIGSTRWTETSSVVGDLLDALELDRTLMATNMLLMWFKTLDHLQCFREMTVLLMSIGMMMSELMSFAGIMVLMYAAFGLSKYVVMTSDEDHSTIWGSVMVEFWAAFLGDVDSDADGGWLSVVAIVFMVMVVIILMNVLVTLLMDMYGEEKEKAEAEWAYFQASMIIERSSQQQPVYRSAATDVVSVGGGADAVDGARGAKGRRGDVTSGDSLDKAGDIVARGIAANVVKRMSMSTATKGHALANQAAAALMAGPAEALLQKKIRSIEGSQHVLEDWEQNPKGMLNAVAVSILSGELSEAAFGKFVCESVVTIPEMGYFVGDVKGPDGNSMDTAVDEELRTRRGLLAAYRIVMGDLDFVEVEGESGDVEAVKAEMMQDMQEWMTKKAGVRDESGLQALLTILAITHLGKVSSLIADVVLKIPGAFQSIDDNQHIEYILDNEHMWDSFLPSFARLDPQYRDWVVAGFRTRFLFEQFEKLECPPQSLHYLGQVTDLTSP
jgi:hypothetical protein